jgi:hypothetical protein
MCAAAAFVAALRNRAEIVLAHVNRQSPKSAARPFPVGSHSIGRRRDGALSLQREDSARKNERPDTPLLPVGAAVPLGGLAGAEARAGRIAERRPRKELLGRDLARHP